MTGTSGGALYTLTCACFIPEIVCAAGVLAVRSHDGRDGGTQTCGQFRDIPGRRGCAVHAMGRPAEGKRRSVRKGAVFKRLRPHRLPRYIFDINGTVPESALPLEKMNCDILILASEKDDVLPAEEAAGALRKRYARRITRTLW